MARLASPSAMRWSRHADLLRQAGVWRRVYATRTHGAAPDGRVSLGWPNGSAGDALEAARFKLSEAKAARTINPPSRLIGA